jgi:hypothetical protein
MFLKNKYTKWYFNLAKEDYNLTYSENHHIIPKSLGGDNSSDNVISVSAKKHFILHKLLTKMVRIGSIEYYKMLNAFLCMCQMRSDNQNRYKMISSVYYEELKSQRASILSKEMKTSKNPIVGKVWISNLELEISKVVEKSELDFYLINGWNKSRIVNFKSYKNRINQKFEENENKLNSISSKNESKNSVWFGYDPFEIHKQYLESGLSIRKFSKNFPFSHVSLYKKFVSLSLSIRETPQRKRRKNTDNSK